MKITYTYTKKQVVELLDIQPTELEKLVKAGKLTRERKIPGNNKSAWLYSAEELDTILKKCQPSDDCCKELPNDTIQITTPKKKWYKFWG